MLPSNEMSIVCGRGQCDMCISGCCCACHGTGDAGSSPMTMAKCEECNGTGLHPARRGYTHGMNLPEIPDSSTAPQSLERADWRGVLALVDNHPFPVRKANHAEPMSPAEVLARAEAFDPTPNREAIMRLALQMIVQSCYGGGGSANIVDHVLRTAEQALRECGN